MATITTKADYEQFAKTRDPRDYVRLEDWLERTVYESRSRDFFINDALRETARWLIANCSDMEVDIHHTNGQVLKGKKDATLREGVWSALPAEYKKRVYEIYAGKGDDRDEIAYKAEKSRVTRRCKDALREMYYVNIPKKDCGDAGFWTLNPSWDNWKARRERNWTKHENERVKYESFDEFLDSFGDLPPTGRG